ncbi:hypothetical protein, partial [Ruminococcus sp. RTP21204st1_B2_RTP21204_210225]|uniref:hypothetical protein n=1 Tax=Ruminococcus sp. RTP21204st1_B2_RTP21204_210225 TaxID=3141602 RepID=UPI0034A5295A
KKDCCLAFWQDRSLFSWGLFLQPLFSVCRKAEFACIIWGVFLQRSIKMQLFYIDTAKSSAQA